MNLTPPPQEKVKLPQKCQQVTVILVDTRSLPRKAELFGILNMPTVLLFGGSLVKFSPKDMKHPLKGVVCDADGTGCNIVFPIVERHEGQNTKGQDMTFEDIITAVRDFEPRLQVVKIR